MSGSLLAPGFRSLEKGNWQIAIGVTGGNGFIASHIVYELLRHEYKVRVTVRDPLDPKNAFLKCLVPSGESVPGDALTLHVGNLCSAIDFTNLFEEGGAFEDVGVLLHTASPFTMSSYKPEDMQQEAVAGVRNVFEAALDAIKRKSKTVKLERIVLTASVVTMMYGHDQRRYLPNCPTEILEAMDTKAASFKTPILSDARETYRLKDGSDGMLYLDERDYSNWTLCKDPYVVGKSLAEVTARELIIRHNAEALENGFKEVVYASCHPGFVMGPFMTSHQAKNSESAVFLSTLVKGYYPVLPKLTCPMVDVRDVAALHLSLAFGDAKKLNYGRFAAVATEAPSMSMSEIAGAISSRMGSAGFKPFTYEVPNWLVHTGGKVFSPFVPLLRFVSEKVGYETAVSNRLTADRIGVEKWISIEDSLQESIISLILLGQLGAKAYSTDDLVASPSYDLLSRIKQIAYKPALVKPA